MENSLPAQLNANRRIASIDAFRSIAMLAVIVIHTQPFWAERFVIGEWPALIINQLARFAVPFFFVVSGFFLARSVTPPRSEFIVIKKQAYRIALVLLFWSLAYLIFIPDFLETFSKQSITKSVYWNLQGLLQNSSELLHQSTRVHLWFLVALLECLLFTALWRAWLPKVSIEIWILSFYLAGMATGPYEHSALGNILPQWLPRLPWTEISLFLIGWWVHSSKFSLSLSLATFIALAGMALHFAEVTVIYHLYETPIMGQDMVFGTAIWALRLVMGLLAFPNAFKCSWVENMGKYTLGVYVVHMVFLDMLNYFGTSWNGVSWTILKPFIVFSLSLLFVYYLIKISWLKRFVS